MRRLAICVALSGCSFATVRGPQRVRAPDQPVRCTTTAAAPIADLAAGMIAAGAFAASMRDPAPNANVDRGLERVQQTMLASGGVFALASAAYGFAKIDRCVRAKQRAES